MSAKPTLFILHPEDKKASLKKLVEGASPDTSFYLLLILSAIIVSLGLQLDSSAVVIGGMLVAPILSPMLSVAMSVVMADFELLKKSGLVLIRSIIIVIACSFLIGLATPNLIVTNEIASRVTTSIPYLIIAVAAGIAAAFAFARPKLSEAFPGVAVSIALLPPLSVSALGIVLNDFHIFLGSLALFFLNFFGIISAAFLVFSLMGFYELRDLAQKEIDKKEEELSRMTKE